MKIKAVSGIASFGLLASAVAYSSLSSAALSTYTNDFEAANAADLNANGIVNFIAQSTGGSYSFAMDGNQGQVATIATGEEGAAQGTQYLNVFSNYDDGTHLLPGETVNANVFIEQTTSLSDADAGAWRFSFDAKRPSNIEDAAANPGASGNPVQAGAFIKCFGADFAFFFSCGTIDTVGISDSEWTSYFIDFNPTTANSGDWDNWIVQIGFDNTAGGFDDTGVYYDNISWSKIAAPPIPVPAAAWLFGSALAGLVVARRKK